jgi:hypothetical protein
MDAPAPTVEIASGYLSLVKIPVTFMSQRRKFAGGVGKERDHAGVPAAGIDHGRCDRLDWLSPKCRPGLAWRHAQTTASLLSANVGDTTVMDVSHQGRIGNDRSDP